MKGRGSALISLLAGILFLVFLVVTVGFFLPRYSSLGDSITSDDGGPVDITDPINQAKSIATQANLKSIQVGLEAYFAENRSYPDSLQELSSSGYTNPGLDVSSFVYLVCGSGGTKVLVYKNSTPYQGLTLSYGKAQNTQSETQPSCL